MSPQVKVEDLDHAIEEYRTRGYRLDMIFPADNPREAFVSHGDEWVRLQKATGRIDSDPQSQSDWIQGRAGMEYRDLIPDRLGGRVIASHVRLTEGGEVADYVHYHKIDFQIIYCIKGRIKVVYEDQGEPFWLKPGDAVVQPPEIRHRVLECEAGSEVIEITSPSEHETWVEHEIALPTTIKNGGRDYSGQKFVRIVGGRDDGGNDAVAQLARSLSAATTEAERERIVTEFSRSLCQK